MNFDFSPEQEQFRDQVRRLLTKTAGLAEARAVLEGRYDYSEPVWKGLAELGVPALMIPERFGGLGFGSLEVCVAAEEIGRTLAPVPALSSMYLCAEAIRLFGSEPQKERWLPGLADGSVIGTWAAVEGAESSSTCTPQTKWSSGRLAGRKLPVLDGTVANVAVVLAQGAAGEPMLALCDLSDPNVVRRRLATLDPSRPVAELTFSDASAEALPAGDERAWQTLLNRAAIFLAFEQLGGADRALSMAREYALQRKAFGRLIGSQQAIKHKLVAMYTNNELARAHSYYGTWALSVESAEMPLAAAGARCAATRAFSYAAQENAQTHGGISFTWESDCHLFYRRARLYELILGSLLHWKSLLVRELEPIRAA